MSERLKDFHDVDKDRVLGEQVFDIIDSAWQAVLVGSGDHYHRRYDGLTGVGLALTTARNRRPKEFGVDNPLVVVAAGPRSTLSRRRPSISTEPTRPQPDVLIGYRYNGQDADAELDPRNLGVRSLDQISPTALRHGKFPINAAAKRYYLLNNPDEVFSYRADGLATGFYGELAAGGGVRYGDLGVVTFSGGDPTHDHVANLRWASMAEYAMGLGLTRIPDDTVTKLRAESIDVLQGAFEHIRGFVARTFAGRRLDELEHHETESLYNEVTGQVASM